MARKGRDITDEEAQLWDLVTSDVTPMKGARKKRETPTTKPVKTTVRDRAPMATPAPVTKSGPVPKDIDRATRDKFERGKMEIEATLDLHGSSQAQAQDDLIAFLSRAWRSGKRCVLVITGKGRDGQGILRSRLPEWVNDAPLRDIVLRVSPAKQRDGGQGAFYVLLRRQRG